MNIIIIWLIASLVLMVGYLMGHAFGYDRGRRDEALYTEEQKGS